MLHQWFVFEPKRQTIWGMTWLYKRLGNFYTLVALFWNVYSRIAILVMAPKGCFLSHCKVQQSLSLSVTLITVKLLHGVASYILAPFCSLISSSFLHLSSTFQHNIYWTLAVVYHCSHEILPCAFMLLEYLHLENAKNILHLNYDEYHFMYSHLISPQESFLI